MLRIRRPDVAPIIATFLAVAIVLAVAIALYTRATAEGNGLSPDSVTYLHAARNLVDHHTLITTADRTSHVVRPTHYPPLYPAVLAVPAFFTGGAEGPARYTHALVIAVSGALFAGLLARYVRPAVVPVGVALIVLSSGFIVEVSAFILSEGLFLCWVLAALTVLLRWLDRHDADTADRWALLVAAAALAGAAALTRFVGIAVIGTGALAIVFAEHRRHRWSLAAVFLAVSGVPLLAWTAYSRSTGGGSIGERQLAVHLPSFEKWRSGLRTASTWVLPRRLTHHLSLLSAEIVGALVVCAAIALLVVAARGAPVGRRVAGVVPGAIDASVTRFGRVAALFAGIYLAVVLLTISLLDTATPLDRRILLPVFVVVLLTALVVGDRFVGRHPGSARIAAAATVLVAVLGANAAGTAADVGDAQRNGLGYASLTWQHSPLVAAVRHLRPGIKVYTNAASAVFLLTGVRAQSIAPRVFGNGSGPNRGFAGSLDLMARRVHAGQSVVVWFRSEHHYFGADLPTLQKVMVAPPSLRSPDGALFGNL